jgi:hypothetical protein
MPKSRCWYRQEISNLFSQGGAEISDVLNDIFF